MSNARVLILNNNFEPIAVCGVERAVVLNYLNRAEMVEVNKGKVLRSQHTSIEAPSVVRLTRYVRNLHRDVPFNKRNVMKRDKFTCQYCGATDVAMTVDHVIPRSLGGPNSWENLVCACKKCNSIKGDKPLHACGLKLKRRPRKPSYFSFILNTVENIPDHWKSYLFAN
jgi:5-methylcytosine-specific restriction endonuclease McrA